ncbi:MAG: bifunctional DNA-formamidopyrimidine glycosylase/DNA-(apurinic or apyrimidinic site) lyase [Bdellovibrionales bacterium]|nr:bifunctional DNA-formamidopyrimidine glycosylase/DNA-(apurinic or apyrimidinic site) lyase [Bdellovibrionales bacterium]
MPELPEVETVKLGLSKNLETLGRIEQVKLFRKDLRFEFPKKMKNALEGQKILSISRRAKYLVFETQDYVWLCHLGMTGAWRQETGDHQKQPHDHFRVSFESGRSWVYRDPRRFGYMDLIKKGSSIVWFEHLGPEPLESSFSSEYLFQKSRNKKAPIKNFIMDQKVVVGVGNIYASEALYMARVKPSKASHRLTRKQAELLVSSIKMVLKKALKSGGSSIRDYKNADAEMGYFQQSLKVYDRAGKPCFSCKKPIKKITQAGRSTFYCSNCQV